MKTILLLLSLLSSPCFADDWTRADTVRQTVYTGLLMADWSQTKVISKKCSNGFDRHEQNDMLGTCPSVNRVNNYFALSALVNVGIAYALPTEWRAPFQYVNIGWEAGWVAHNYSIGIRFGF